MSIFLTAVFVALSVSFFCSLMEATLLSLTPSQVAKLSLVRPRLGAIWQNFKSNIEQPISVILVLNTAAHTIGAAVAGYKFNELAGGRWIWIFSFAFTFVMLQFTEILPKTLGVRYNGVLARIMAVPLNTAIAVLTPVLKLVQWINRPFQPKDVSKAPRTVEEIAALASFARLSNQIGIHQERIIKGASRLSQVSMRQVMIPVEDVSFISTSQSLTDAIIAAHIDAHTRYPVCKDNDRNNVVGYINFKEMIYYVRTNPANPRLEGIIRPVQFASPDEIASDWLRIFVDQHVHMAIVRDESKTLGLVTLEDLVEELVGELQDEFDRLPRLFHALSGGTWMVGGGLPINEVASQLNLPIPQSPTNMSDWMIQKLGERPKPGDSFREANAEFTVRRVRRGRVFEVAVTFRPEK